MSDAISKYYAGIIDQNLGEEILKQPYGRGIVFTLNPKYSTWHSHMLARATRADIGADSIDIVRKLLPMKKVITARRVNLVFMVIPRFCTKLFKFLR